MTAPQVHILSAGLARGFSKNLDEHVAMIARQVGRSMRDGDSRRLAVKIVSGSYDYVRDRRTGKEVPVVRAYNKTFLAPRDGEVCPARNDTCEIERIWDFLVLNCRYTEDPYDIDTFATLKETLLAGGGDCFPEGTLLLRDDGALIPVEQLRPGERIWGYDRWSDVTQVWAKGDLPLTAIRLNNGSTMRLTDNHKVYVGVCHRHAGRTPGTAGCSCAIEDREVVRIPVVELQTAYDAPHIVLLQPDQIVLSRGAVDADRLRRLELDGLFVADGWVEEKSNGHIYRAAIAGRDGHPKEEQKRRVVALCDALGIETSWADRYVRIRNTEMAQHFARFGRGAPNKTLLKLPTVHAEVEALLKGVLADAGKNTHGDGYTFTSTSRLLALQTRVLHRMLGMRTGWSYIERHGGLGSNPIYRVTGAPADASRVSKLLRVKEIIRNFGEVAPVWDISTDDHYVYLPEHDVTVSNCDDATVAFATLLRSIGFQVIARVISTKDAPNKWVHIYPLVGVPKNNPTGWVPLDITVEGATPGWEYRDIAKRKDYVL